MHHTQTQSKMKLHSAGRDPVTWSFAKLFARHVTQELREFEGMPGSHAWCWRSDRGLWRARLVTKAQIVGVVVAVLERTERGALADFVWHVVLYKRVKADVIAVEFLVDDGTAVLKAVRWSNATAWDHDVALGDLVHVQGKLNVDWTTQDDSGANRAYVLDVGGVSSRTRLARETPSHKH